MVIPLTWSSKMARVIELMKSISYKLLSQKG